VLQQCQIVMDCPPHLVGLLIGKKGWTIKKIQQETSAQVRTSQPRVSHSVGFHSVCDASDHACVRGHSAFRVPLTAGVAHHLTPVFHVVSHR
jgi:hypothetical protein